MASLKKPILSTNFAAATGKGMSTYRDVTTGAGDKLTERYERTMSRLEQIKQAGYSVELQFE